MAITLVKPDNEDAINFVAVWLERHYKGLNILDVGGAACPLRVATHVMDLTTFAKRRRDHHRGAVAECFTEDTWYRWDVNVTPWPYPTNFFDFVWCSQLVEDIRDPIAVCREMQRVAPRGFISTVQRDYESSVVQDDGVVGYHHHRWLIEADEAENQLSFMFKSPILHVNPKVRPIHDPLRWLLNFTWERPFKVRETFCTEGYLQLDELNKYLRERSGRNEN